jgi:branched-chain amino acid transport system ATP-binding protein
MSGGEQQMLALGRALASRPAVLLLDELSTGLAPKVVDELYAVVADEVSRGMTVLLVEQYADKALDIAGSAAVMQGGRIVAAGAPDELRGRLEELYLGDGAGTGPGDAPAAAPEAVPNPAPNPATDAATDEVVA